MGKFYASIEGNIAESGDAYRSFLAVAPPDHRWVPRAHYTLAVQRLKLKEKKLDFEELLRPGLEAERVQLPCFLPVVSQDKQFLERMRKLSTSTKSSLEAEAEQAAERFRQQKKNAWLNDLRRTELFSAFREAAAFQKGLQGSVVIPWSVTPLERASAAPLNAILKAISLAEMDPRADVIYQGRVLSVAVLTVLVSFSILMHPFFSSKSSTFSPSQVPHWTGSSLSMLIQDTGGECNRLFIYNKLDFIPALGDILGITNPHHRIARDMKAAIRVDDPHSVLKTGRKIKPCNACGEEKAKYSCHKCGVNYCSKECQMLDWSTYLHKRVCVAG